jgi:hypothetical protein
MDAIHSEVNFRRIYKSLHNVSTLTCLNCIFWLLQKEITWCVRANITVSCGFVWTLTFSVFERCNELPISHCKEQYLFNHLVKYLLTVKGNVLSYNPKLLDNKPHHTNNDRRPKWRKHVALLTRDNVIARQVCYGTSKCWYLVMKLWTASLYLHDDQ